MERVKSKIDLNKLNAKCERILKEVLALWLLKWISICKVLKSFRIFFSFADLLIKFVLFKCTVSPHHHLDYSGLAYLLSLAEYW